MAGSRRHDSSGSPFKRLKGFRVSSSPKEQSPPSAKPAAEPQEEDGDLFAREMARLGVKGEGAPEPSSAPTTKGESTPSPEDDGGLFLAALGQLDAVFQDEIPGTEEQETCAAAPRRMKLVRQGKLIPEARLDLHGLTREEARARTRHFLENAAYHGRKTVLIITGRGKGSEGEPVLRAELERYLSQEGRAWGAEWGRAPRQYGGVGALVGFLKG